MKKIYFLALTVLSITCLAQNNRLESTGNVGIGTSNPANLFEISSSNGTVISDGSGMSINRINNSCGAWFELGNNNNTSWIIKNGLEGCGNLGDLNFINANQYHALTIKQAGNVGIGTYSPLDNAKLTIKGDTGSEWKMLALDGKTDDWFLGSFGGGGFFIAKDNFGSTSSRFTIIDDKVGIGTNSPSARLHVEKSSGSLLRLSNDANNYLYSGIDSWGAYIEQVSNTSGKSKIRLQARNANQGTYSQFYINGENNSFNLLNGKTGIGTSSPSGLLEIVGPYTGDSQLIINTTSSNGELRFSDNGAIKGFVWYNASNNLMAFGRGGITNSMFVDSSGKIAIGTTDFTGNHKLRVEGTIASREVKVQASGWADYVFERDYDLKSLEEVENHITEKGHLPEIPSEAEVKENGINLGEMDAKLLQKIEELTLYLIEQNKEIQALKSKNEELEKRLTEVEN